LRVRIATFNLENLDHRPGQEPSLDKRIEALRPALVRLDADVLCLQEVNAQGNKHRTLKALEALLEGTPYADFSRVATQSDTGKLLRDVQNLVTLSRFPIAAHEQFRHDLVSPPAYELATVETRSQNSREISWDRPVLASYAESDFGIYAVYPHRRHVSAKVRAFVDYFVERFGPAPYWDEALRKAREPDDG
jgi:hypothetical protein